jgi:hypothetical protein
MHGRASHSKGSFRSRRFFIACCALAGLLVALATADRAASSAATTLEVGGEEIEVEFADETAAPLKRALLDHIERAACAVSAYYGRFPVRHYRILIVPVAARAGVLSGTTWGYGGPHSRILVGEETKAAQLRNDWVFTHEMVHTAFPDLPDQNRWIEEGIATYVEPLARSWVGDYPPAQVWADLVAGLPKGLPAAGDEGLDHTHTWGRTYWGGAMFCTLADVGIRRRTGNQRGLIDALRAILQASGGIEANWKPEQAFKVGDSAVGVPVLEELYGRMRANAVKPDLQQLWQQLGVNVGSSVSFDASAPEASIRRAISEPPPDPERACIQA